MQGIEGSLLFLAFMVAIFYFMLIRPNRRRRQDMERLQSALSVGDEVMTSSGLYGTVAEVDERTIILETSEGVYSRYARGAIVERVNSGQPDAEPSSEPGSDPAVEQRDSKD